MAEAFVSKYSGLLIRRDLTLNEEAAQVLSIASEILSKGVPLEEIRPMVHKDPTKKSAILISAVGSAGSKLKLRECGPLRMTFIFAKNGEQNRMHATAEHENGQDLVRNSVDQLKWLFDGEDGKTWDILTEGDGCPNDSIGLARKSVGQEGYDNVRLGLQEWARSCGSPVVVCTFWFILNIPTAVPDTAISSTEVCLASSVSSTDCRSFNEHATVLKTRSRFIMDCV